MNLRTRTRFSDGVELEMLAGTVSRSQGFSQGYERAKKSPGREKSLVAVVAVGSPAHVLTRILWRAGLPLKTRLRPRVDWIDT